MGKVKDSLEMDYERPDLLSFPEGDIVKVHMYNRAANDDHQEMVYHYYLVLEDNRFKSHCTYTYTLDRVYPPPPGKDIYGGRRVFCYYPKEIEPLNEVEEVLYGSRD